LIYASGHTDRQTNRHTVTLLAILYRGGGMTTVVCELFVELWSG